MNIYTFKLTKKHIVAAVLVVAVIIALIILLAPGGKAAETGAAVTIRDRGCYAIFLDIAAIRSARLLKGVCSHELGHAATGALHKVHSPYETVERSEYRANRWVARHYLTEEDFEFASRLCRAY